MATEAQVAANRLNAQKSTGPRTAEGKAVVAQNAVKHGLLAREGVLRGEDGEEFERHREALMEQLNPAGALEVIPATRIVDLTWRLQRAAQDQNETFGALYDRHTAGAPEPADPAERGATLGRMILCETKPICSKPDVSQVQYGTTVMSDTAADGLQKTNPICAAPRGTGIPSASLSGQALPVNPDHGRDAHATHGRDGRATHGQDGHATEPPGGIPTIRVEAQEQLCETNPIVETIQVFCSTGVTADLGEERSYENKANFPVLRQGRSHRAGQPAVAEADSAKQSQFAERTAWAKAHPTSSRLEFGQPCGTNPISGWDGTGRGPRDGG